MDAFNTLFLWSIAGVVFWLISERGKLAGRLDALEREFEMLGERLAVGVSSRLPIAPVASTPRLTEIPAPPSAPPAAPAPAYSPLLREYALPEIPAAPPLPREPMPRQAVPTVVHGATTANAPAPEPPVPQPERQRGPSLEERIGGHWLSWAGAVTLVITLVIGLQWAIAAGYVTWVFHLPPMAYLVAGWLAGGALLGAGEWLRTRLPLYAQGLAGAGIAALYSTTYAGDALYHVLPASGATLGLAAIGLLAIGMAVRHDSVVIGWIGVLASYASPVLLGGNSPSPTPLLLYVTALNAAVLGISVVREWSLFRLAAFLASVLLYGLWHNAHYAPVYLTEALLFTAVNFVLFLGVLALYPLVWRKPTRDTDLALAVLNPVLTAWLLHALLQPRYADSMGLVAGAMAAVYWLLSRALRARRGEADYLEQLFHATSLVFALLAVPLQFKGRAMTPAWALVGAALSMVGYRGSSDRTRWWGVAALGLSLLRLLAWDAPYTPGPGPVIFFNLRGFAFASVLLSLAVAAGTWADQWRHGGRQEGPALSWLAGLALAISGLLDYWIWLDVPEGGAVIGWSVVAALMLGFGWHLRSREIRALGTLLSVPPVFFAARYAFEHSNWMEHAPGLLSALGLCLGAAWAYHRCRERMPEEHEVLVPSFVAGGVAVALVWAWVDLGLGWLPVSWVAVALLLLWAGMAGRRGSLRILGAGVAVLATVELFARELTLPAAHVLLHHRSAALLAGVLVWAVYGWAMKRTGNEAETPAMPVLFVLANALGLLWLSLEAMDVTSRYAPPHWSAHAAQFGLSAAWILYAAASIAVGFRWSLAGARWGGMALLGATVVKVYLFDLGQLALGYRLVSFLCLAAILLGVSYAYQRRERASRIS